LNRLQLVDIKYRSIFIFVISEYSSYHISRFLRRQQLVKMFNVSTQYVESHSKTLVKILSISSQVRPISCGVIALAITLTVGMHIYLFRKLFTINSIRKLFTINIGNS